ncbi:hypothetical protein [Lactococcus lactis]|uniref:hypothetical protein n=1 Tax=Lactococcus lactis TaxID=1358 RepID=UPI0024185EE0|nr:hypothetical protein [Lactococcus lactis]MDG4990277.1 hypothetical protein [Lactococcus lactis]
MWGIYKEQGGNSSYFSNFIEITGCPFEESITILREIEIINENIEEITPCFEGNLRECAIHYISGFDVLSSIKVYDFLESYNLSYDLYDEAAKEFQQLSDQQNLAY